MERLRQIEEQTLKAQKGTVCVCTLPQLQMYEAIFVVSLGPRLSTKIEKKEV